MTTIQLSHSYVTVNCGPKDSGGCGLAFAMTRQFYDQTYRTGETWYCPKGHPRVWGGDSTETKLEKAKAREVALKDQLAAAVSEGELTRQALLRDRQRFANGVCPCCNRSFENVRRHMSTKHPDYDPKRLARTVEFKCSCGRAFETLRGLRTHQGHARPDDWAVRGQKKDWWNQHQAHLTEAGAR